MSSDVTAVTPTLHASAHPRPRLVSWTGRSEPLTFHLTSDKALFIIVFKPFFTKGLCSQSVSFEIKKRLISVHLETYRGNYLLNRKDLVDRHAKKFKDVEEKSKQNETLKFMITK